MKFKVGDKVHVKIFNKAGTILSIYTDSVYKISVDGESIKYYAEEGSLESTDELEDTGLVEKYKALLQQYEKDNMELQRQNQNLQSQLTHANGMLLAYQIKFKHVQNALK